MRVITTAIILISLASFVRAGELSKISPEVLQAPGGKTKAIVVSRDPSRPGGIAFRRAEMSPARFRKMAADTSIIAILPNRPIKVPPVPGPRNSWFNPDPFGLKSLGQEPIAPSMWLAKDIHGAPIAWKSGYTGAGVKIGVMDEGIDFGHPDLQGCQARVTNPESPYYGWPIAFDPSPMAIYATTGAATEGYCDTTETVTDADPQWRDGAIILPGTSKSGVYHIGVHGSYWLPFIIGRWGFPPIVLVADEHTAGVYDTVYVDIDKDQDFRNDKPCRRGDEISSWDADGDGLADYSAGMLYFIADGVNPIPASDWLYHLAPPENGCLVCFAGSFGKYDSHGTLVASAISARGKSGSTYRIPQKPENSGGMVYGVAPGAGLIQVGSIYDYEADIYDAIQFCILGYDGKPGTGDEADIVNMSFGISSEDLDGWDFLSRYITYVNRTVAPKTTFVAATGNGGPGYGTVTPPAGAPSAVSVGAMTMYGSTDAFDPIESASQILYGDIQQWSNRGPSSLGHIKPDVVAVGAWATGDVPVYGSGEDSWAVWAGTSLSAPITSGVLSLVYEAYKKAHGVYPTCDEAKSILMSGAKDLSYNVFEQGAGMIDAAKATGIAAGTDGLRITPPTWAAGSYQGAEPEAFPHVLRPGQSSARTFTVENTGKSAVTVVTYSRRLVRTSWTSFDITAKDSAEDPADIGRPDYLVDITKMVPPNTDLLRIRVSMPYYLFSTMPPSFSGVAPESLWIASLYDWTDLNRDKLTWNDKNHNGVVNVKEFEYGELNRFMIANPTSDVIEISVKNPLERIHNGLMFGLIHSLHSINMSTSKLRVDLEAYREVEWDWIGASKRPVVLQSHKSISLPVTMNVPDSAAPGLYTGSLVIHTGSGKDTNEATVPISTTVLPSAARMSNGLMAAGNNSGGDTYDNGRMMGAFDWGWRDESGDWRFYFLDLPAAKAGATSYILANASWRNIPTDNDILIYQPNASDFFSQTMPSVFGPHGLTLSGASVRTLQHDGLWLFQTATGGASEWVAGQSKPGLNLIQLHNVLDSGYAGSEPFDLYAGQVTIQPETVEFAPGQTTASVRLTSSIGLAGLSAIAYGPNAPQVLDNQWIGQDYPYTPKYASWLKDIDVHNAGLIDITTSGPAGTDIDLYLLYDANRDGVFDWDSEVVASSATQTSNEHIRLLLPTDGSYRIAVHGFSVPQPATFNMALTILDGDGFSVTGPSGRVFPGTQQTIGLTLKDAPVPGSQGILFLGPPEAPYVLPLAMRIGN